MCVKIVALETRRRPSLLGTQGSSWSLSHWTQMLQKWIHKRIKNKQKNHIRTGKQSEKEKSGWSWGDKHRTSWKKEASLWVSRFRWSLIKRGRKPLGVVNNGGVKMLLNDLDIYCMKYVSADLCRSRIFSFDFLMCVGG